MISVKVFESIRDVDAAAWDAAVAGRSCALSRPFLDLVETSNLNDFSYRYVMLHDPEGALVGVASFYTVTTDVAIFATGPLRRLLSAIRRAWPGFLKLRMLECGTPLTVTSPPLILRDEALREEATAALDALLIRTARAERRILVVVRDFEAGAARSIEALRGLGYCCVEGLPNTYLEIPWADPKAYLGAMRSYFRSKVLKHVRKIEGEGVTATLTQDFGGLADELCRQWLNVHGKAAELQREVLNAAFYRGFAALGPHAKVVLFHRAGALVGHVLLLQDGEMLRWLYVGRSEAVNDSLYIFAAYKVVETAIALGAKRLELGLTTYPVKLDLGAEPASNRLAIKSPYRLIQPLIRLAYPRLNHVPEVRSRQVFKAASPAPGAPGRGSKPAPSGRS